MSQKAEDGRVAVRNIRRDANTHIEKLEKSSDVSEDDVEHAKKEIQDVTNAMIKEIDRAAEKKTAEVMEV